jgi:hypothetical protein
VLEVTDKNPCRYFRREKRPHNVEMRSYLVHVRLGRRTGTRLPGMLATLCELARLRGGSCVSWIWDRRRYRCVLPRQQFFDPTERVIGSAAQYVAVPAFGINAVETCRSQQSVDGSRALTTAVGRQFIMPAF